MLHKGFCHIHGSPYRALGPAHNPEVAGSNPAPATKWLKAPKSGAFSHFPEVQVLVDELWLIVYPVVLGAGERLFGDTSDKKSIRPLNARTVGDRLIYLTYELPRDAYRSPPGPGLARVAASLGDQITLPR